MAYLPDDILVKVDRSTMFVGLEGREPLLDHRIVEFISRIPSNIKYKDDLKKYILKEITHKYLPKELITHAWMEIYADTVTIGINKGKSFSVVIQNQEVYLKSLH